MQNPYSNTFGIKPKQYVVNSQINEILENFSYEEPTERAYLITGVRGSGKTVMLTDISDRIGEMDGWTVMKLVPSDDILFSFASKLYSHPLFKAQFAKAKIDISFLGIGISIEDGADKFFDIETAIEKMLTLVKKQKKKILITIDEAEPSKSMELFCLVFQGLIRDGFPVYLIMTGLHNKINDIQQMDKCTFLTRTPKLIVEPLDEMAIASSYKKTFAVDKETANKMARLTKGYAYAYQTLGRLFFNSKKRILSEELLNDYESELIMYSYKTIWNELSPKDIELVKAIANLGGDEPVSRETLLKETNFTSSMLNLYKDRLQESGIINRRSAANRGLYYFVLPMFENFVKDYYC